MGGCSMNSAITFGDFCAGIGGFRLGLESLGWNCVYSCEIDKYCRDTYALNYGIKPDGVDIFDVQVEMLPKMDVFCAGFPCQPYSIAGKQLGLNDPRSEVINKIFEIIHHNKPTVVFLENVPNLTSHNNGASFEYIKSSIESLGYSVFFEILNSTYFGVPQNRHRVYIVAIKTEFTVMDSFTFTKQVTPKTTFRNFISKGDYSIPLSKKWQAYIDLYLGYKDITELEFQVPKTRVKLERIEKDAELADCIFQIRSSGIRAISLDSPLPTFAVSNSGGGAMIPVYTGERRHVNITEMKRIMGFPDNFKFNTARTHIVKQLANAVCPPVIKSIGVDISNILSRGLKNERN